MRRSTTALMLGAVAATAVLVSVPSASARSAGPEGEPLACGASDCDGGDPMMTGCGVAARTADHTAIDSGGTAELRASRLCQTSWVRVRDAIAPSALELCVTDRSRRSTECRRVDDPGVVATQWGEMIHAPPDHCVEGWVLVDGRFPLDANLETPACP